jgi:hypothetical protein
MEMNGRNVVRLALLAALSMALVGASIPGAAMAQYPNSGGNHYPNSGGDQYPDNSGGKWWNPETTQDQQFHRGDFEGRWLAQDRFDTNDRGGGWGQNGRFGMTTLPNFLNIDQGRRAVRIADRRNNLVQTIAIEDGARGFRNQATFLRGQIHGSRLVAFGTDARGRQMKQTMLLRDRGTTLVVRTQIEGRSGRTMTFEKVYARA